MPIRICFLLFLCLLLGLGTGSPVTGQVFNERFDDWPLETRIAGSVIVADTLDTLGPIVPLLSQSRSSGKLLLLCNEEQAETLVAAYEEIGMEVVCVTSIQDAQQAAAEQAFEFIAWHTRPYFATAFNFLDSHARWLKEHVSDGGTAIVIGRQAAWCGSAYFSSDAQLPETSAGADLMPDVFLDLNFDQPSSRPDVVKQRRVLSYLALHPRTVGIGLDQQTALLLSGRRCVVSGQGGATFILAGNKRVPQRIERLVPRVTSSEMYRRQATTEWLADLTEWRRDAIDRTLEPFPALKPLLPKLENGTLFIVGGGGMPRGLMQDFVDRAGGEKARLVYVPCSESNEVSSRQSIVEAWKKMGVASATFIHTKDRRQANEDDEFLAPLRDATGIWFGGGRQWNFADSYYGTQAHRLMKEVLHRGGVCGGSSAGASIQARYLARATPIENFRIMAPGYERGGLGFLSGVAIDQHFSQRGRQKDMTQLVNRYPQMLGIGIDEATALVVEGSVGRVVGRGKVHFYDRRQPVYPDLDDFVALEAGQHYDLVKREEIK